MPWRDTLMVLREELSEVRSERQRRAAAYEAESSNLREELARMIASLGASELLTELNSILLQGQGKVEVFSSWEPDEDDKEDEDVLDITYEEDDEGDVITTMLSWEEDGERELAVDVGKNDQGIFLQVNGADIRLDRDSLETALIQAFREELEL